MTRFTLRVENIGKHFGSNRVFDDINFDHTEGVLGIAGSNGSGKSTLLQCLAGLIRPSSGRVEWYRNEQRIDLQEIRRKLGYTASYINLYEELSCEENLRFLLQLRSVNEGSKAINKVLAQTGMNPFASKLFGNLSTGQQQRMRLAAALVHKPDILFLDEPGSNLDERGRNVIKSLVDEFRQAEKMVVLASNNPDELELCDRIYSVELEGFV